MNTKQNVRPTAPNKPTNYENDSWLVEFDSGFDNDTSEIEASSRVVEPEPICGCEPADLQNMCFTILDIAEEPQPSDSYHFFKWRFLVRLQKTGEQRTFLMNPSKKRNQKIERLAQALPMKNITLEKKDFTDMRTGKLIVYYDLANFTQHSGTISH